MGIDVEQALERNIFLLDLANDFFGELLELAERRHAEPAAMADHLAVVESLVGELRPAAVETDLEDRAHQSASGLLHVDHVGHQRESVQS